MALRERFHSIAAMSNLLVSTSVFTFVLLLARSGGVTLLNLAISLGLVLITNFLFVLTGLLVPSLAAPGRLVFPLNLTLPLVFSSLGIVVAYLGARIGNPLEPAVEPFRRFAGNFREMDILWFPLVQIATMTVSMNLVGRRRVDSA